MAADLVFGMGAALALVYLIRYVEAPVSVARTLFKTAAVLALGSVAVIVGHPLVGFALLASAAGDLALSRDGDRAFLAGMAAFGVAHLCYAAIFWSLGGGLGALAEPTKAIGAIAVLGLAASTTRWLLPHAGRLAAPVGLYVALIAAMGLCALTLQGWGLALSGAVLFILSDLVLAIGRFRLSPGDPRAGRAARFVWLSYWPAQALILIGLTVP